jgi:hypothetical protein
MAVASARTGTPPPGRGLAQPSPQLIAEDDERGDRCGGRAEQIRQRAGQVAHDGSGPGGLAQRGALAADPGHPVFGKPGQEGIEVLEVTVQHALGHPGLGRDRAAGQGTRTGPEQNPLGGSEQLLPCVPQSYPVGTVRRPSFAVCGTGF